MTHRAETKTPPCSTYAAIMRTFAGGIDDRLQGGFAALTSKANELDQRLSQAP